MTAVLLLVLSAGQTPDIQDATDGLLLFVRGIRTRSSMLEGVDAVTDFQRSADAYDATSLRDVPWVARTSGNARFLAGDLPRAILAYRRGLRSDPADERLRTALDYTRSQVRPADAEAARRIAVPADLWPPWLALRRLGVYAFALYCVGCFAFTRWRMTRRPAYGWAALVAFALAAVPCVGSLLEARDRRRDAVTPVVVATRDIELRAGNGVEYPTKLPLPRGGEVRRLFDRGGWLQVEAADGTVGWLPADAVVGGVRSIGVEILIASAVLVVALAVVVNRLRPAQRLVVLAGALAAVAQVFYPPCVLMDGSVTRRWMDTSLTYHANDAGVWIDAARQAIWLTVTAAMVVLVCGVLAWRHRLGQSEERTRSR